MGKNANVGQAFESPKFTMFNLEWSLEVYPNGTSDAAGYTEIFCNLTSLPPTVQKMQVQYKLEMSQEKIATRLFSRTISMDMDEMYLSTWPIATLSFENLRQHDAFS